MKIFKSLSLIAAAVALIVGATYAYFSDSVTSSENTFSSGTLSINDSKLTDAVELEIENMAPGDVSDEYSVVIENNGTINLAWLGDWQFSGGDGGSVDLKDALYIDYAKMEFLSPTDDNWLDDSTLGYEPDGSDIFIEDGVGHGPYPGPYTALIGGPLSVLSLNQWNNNSTMVPSSDYEHAGALKPNYKYRLTVKFGFAPSAGNDYQNLGPVTAKLQVNATQINTDALQDQGVPAATADEWTKLTPTTGWLHNQIADQIEP